MAWEEIREAKSFTIATNNTKCLGVTLTQQVDDLYDNDFKYLKKETGEDTRRWKDSHAHKLVGLTQ